MKLFFKKLLLISSLLLQMSCSLLEIKSQSEQLAGVSFISGTMENVDTESPIYAVLLKRSSTSVEISAQVLIDENNRYQFHVIPGSYIIGTYIDNNKNGRREDDEFYGLYSQDNNPYQIIKIGKDEQRDLESFSINRLLGIEEGKKYLTSLSKSLTNVGKVVSLDDDVFLNENSQLGLWQPLTFVNKVGGGLFMLQAYEPNKTPVVFVHGILGNPKEFEKIINALDRDKYQPWVLYYPSGLQLDLISDYLQSSLNQLKEQYGFTDINLITHSMGGLMSRSFLMKHQKQASDYGISLYMTINSPMYGMQSATSGVESSPIIIPSWRDIAINSDYIKRVHNWQIPNNTDYHLVFSYLPNEEGDGVVPMSSQLSLSLQEEATQIYGFQAQHAQILVDGDFIKRFNKILVKHHHLRTLK
jgi:uncharacterized alpha/beta hydrolase family protein